MTVPRTAVGTHTQDTDTRQTAHETAHPTATHDTQAHTHSQTHTVAVTDAAANNPTPTHPPIHPSVPRVHASEAPSERRHSFFGLSIVSMTATHGGGPSFGQAFSKPTSIACSTGWSMYGMSGIRARPAPRHTWSQPHRPQLSHICTCTCTCTCTSAQRTTRAEAASYGRTNE